MAEPNSRPVGVTLVAWLFVVVGVASALAVVVWFARSGRITEGLPLEVIGGVAVAVFLGVLAGAKLLQGRSWAWYEATSLCVLTLGLGGFSVALKWGHPALGPGLAALGLVLLIYLQSRSVIDFFGIKRRASWILLVTELTVCAVILLGLYFATRGPDPVTADSSLLLQALGEHAADSDNDLQFMLERLENGNGPERVSAAWALGQSGRADAVPQLLRAAREESDTDVRINVIASLAALGGPEIERDLVGFLDDADAEIQAAGLRGLAHEKFAGAASRVGQLLLENVELRSTAADVLGTLGNPEAVPFLLQAADDAEEDVRTRIAFALGKLGDAQAVPTLIDLLHDQQWSVRANAAQALGMIGDSSAREALEGTRNDPNSSVRAASDAALEKLP